MTPEGVVKRRVRAVLNRFPGLYQYWPVPTGYGPAGLDCYVCFRGRLIAIETKAAGKHPTPRQRVCIHELKEAGARTFVIDGTDNTDSLESLEAHLLMIGGYDHLRGPNGHEAVPASPAPAADSHPA